MAGEQADDAAKKPKGEDAGKSSKPKAEEKASKAKVEEKPSKPKSEDAAKAKDKAKAEASPAKPAKDSAADKPAKAKTDEDPAAKDKAAKGAAAAEAPPPPEPKEESSYGLFVEPASSFEAARQVAKQLHETLKKLQDIQGDGEGVAKEPSFVAVSRETQNQLLALRRAHRGMAKAAEMGRLAEGSARKIADAEYALLETRRYESACCRAAARRCRAYPTPQLAKLRPLLDGASEADAQNMEEEECEADERGLAARLETEKAERCRLADELGLQETRKAADLEAFRESETFESDLMTRLRAAERALEPVCDLLELRARPDDAAALPDTELLAQLPPPLRLVYSKFDVLASFGGIGGVAVHIDEPAAGEEPPTKKAKTEGGSTKRGPPTLRVEITGKPSVTLRIACPHSSLVTMAVEGGAGEAWLQNLWPEDDGLSGGLGAMEDAAGVTDKPGRAFGWSQVLAGLREGSLMASSALATSGGVTASDVVLRLRKRAAEKPKA